MSESNRVLLIQKDPEQTRFLLEMLASVKAVPFQVEAILAPLNTLEQLHLKDIEIVLVDLGLVSHNMREMIDHIRMQSPHTVIIILTDSENEAVGLNAVAVGAQDYLVKEELTPRILERTLRVALERRQQPVPFRKTDDRLQMIIESIQDFAIFSMDANGHIDFWNSGAEHIFGYTEAEVIGQHNEILFTIEDRAQRIPSRELQTAAEKGSAMDERWHKKKDGRLFYASGMTRPIYDERNQLIGFTKVARDLTDRQLAQEQRDSLLQRALEARNEAEQANTLKEEFLALISHELKNPLASIVGFASMGTSKTMTWPLENMVEFSAIIQAEAMKMSNLIEQLVDRARQRTATLKIDFEVTSLQETLPFAIAQLRALTTQHQLVIDIPTALPDIYVDPQRIAQVLTNLVGNAARYSPSQTPITLTAHVAGQFLQVDVIDEGRGIPPDQRQKVFESFHQVDRSSTKGIGLGLALCKNLIERHHGQIWVQDHSGPGTIMSFTLPIAESDV